MSSLKDHHLHHCLGRALTTGMILLGLFAVRPGQAGEAEPFSQELANFDFNNAAALKDWHLAAAPQAYLAGPDGAKGLGRLRLEAGKTAASSSSPSVNIPIQPAGEVARKRVVVLRFSAKTLGPAGTELTVRILQRQAAKGYPQFPAWPYPRWLANVDAIHSSDFLVVRPAADGQEFTARGWLAPDAGWLSIQLEAKANAEGAAILLDDLRLELLPVVFHSASANQIFTAESGRLEAVVPQADRLRQGNIRIEDEGGRTVRELTLAPGRAVTAIELPAGYSRLTLEATYADGVKLRQTTAAAVIGRVPDFDQRRNSSVGVVGGTYLSEYSGVSWERTFCGLPKPVQKDGQFDFAAPLESRPVAPGALRYIRCFWYPPAELTQVPAGVKAGSHDAYLPKDWDEFKRYVEWAAAGRLKNNRTACVEVINEPDAGHWKGTDADLVKYHAVVAQAVKAVLPEVRVIGPCYYSIRLGDLDRLVKLGLLDQLDGLAVHSYVSNNAEPEGDFIDGFVGLKKYLAGLGRPDYPVYLTEFGWSTAAGSIVSPVDELTQARYHVRAQLLLAAVGIEAVCAFIMDYGQAPNPGEYHFSLVRQDGTPKPAYAALAQVARQLTEAEKGSARWLRLAPACHLVHFRTPGGVLLALWHTRQTGRVSLPAGTAAASADITGRPLEIGADGQFEIGPSPVFLSLSDPSFADLARLEPREIYHGQEVELPWDECLLPPELAGRAKGRKFSVDLQVPPGEYLLIGKSAAGWQVLPLRVRSPLKIVKSECRWDGLKPRLEVEVGSELGAPAEVQIAFKPENAPDLFCAPATLRPRENRTFELPLAALAGGTRYRGELLAETRVGETYHADRQNLELTLTPCASCAGAEPVWAEVPVIDFSRWDPFRGSGSCEALAPADCSATLQAAYTPDALRLLVRVRDDRQVQTQADPAAIWAQDSLQIAFDVDRDRPWKVNSWDNYNGHRVLEYGVARGESGPVTYRWISYSQLPAKTAETGIQARIVRENDVTVYDLTFPWPTLSLSAAPAAGSTFGFSLAVNDFDDRQTGRHGLRLYGGIVEGKNPEKFGALWFCAPAAR